MSSATLSYRPASLNLEFVAGDDVPVPLTFSMADDAGIESPLSLAGCQVEAYIEDGTPGSPLVIGSAITNAEEGKVLCTITSDQSNSLNSTGKSVKRSWFVQIVDSLGARRTYVSGTVTILPKV